jgi:hypothetical protein
MNVLSRWQSGSGQLGNVFSLFPLSWLAAAQNVQHASFLDVLPEFPLTHSLTGSACVYALQADGGRVAEIQRLGYQYQYRHCHAG